MGGHVARLGVLLDDVLATKEATESAVEAERQRANAEQERADAASPKRSRSSSGSARGR